MSAVPDRTPPPRGRETGCLKMALIGFAALALAGIAGLVVLRVYMRTHPALARGIAISMVDQMEDRMRRQFGSDVSEEDRREFDGAVARFNEALRDRPEILEDSGRWRGHFVVRRGQVLHHEDVLRLISDFRAIAARAGGEKTR
jgi:hypothetical protein